MSRATSMVLASGRAKRSPRVKLRVSLATVTIIVGSSARARPDSSNKQSRTSARMMPPRGAGSTYASGRSENVVARLFRALGRDDRAGKGSVALHDGQDPIGEMAHVELGLAGRHPAIREVGHHVIGAGEAPQLAQLLDAIIPRADDLDAYIEVRHFLSLGRILQLAVGFRHLAVGLVTFDVRQMAVGEMVMRVDRVPLGSEVLQRPLVRFGAGRRAGDVG